MKLGFVSMPVTGHLNPMTALARKLQSRGNEVAFIGLPDDEPILRAANLNFVPFCEQEYPVGSVAKGYASLAKLHGLHVVEHSAREIHPGRCKSALEHLPEKLAETGVQALVIDTVHFFVELVPMRLGMPYGFKSRRGRQLRINNLRLLRGELIGTKRQFSPVHHRALQSDRCKSESYSG